MWKNLKVKIECILGKKQGETLLELVFSIGLFAVVILMTASMFAAANRVSLRSLQTEQDVDQAVSDIVKEENIEASGDVTITFEWPDGDLKNINAEEIQVQGLHKFREK